MLGILTLLALMKGFGWLFESAAGASPVAQVAHQANDLVSPINTVWVLVTAFLVFFMQAGFMALEAGFARSRETVNILLECVFDTCLCGVLYWGIGFAFQFVRHPVVAVNDQYVLDAAGDVEFSVFHETQVAGAQPAVVDGFRGRDGVVVIAGEDAGTLEPDFADRHVRPGR